MSRLNQILAIEKNIKNDAEKKFTELHHLSQQVRPLNGLSRRYLPKEDGGDMLPPESTKVQVTAEDIIRDVSTALVELFDVIATKDSANTKARADVVVDGITLLKDIPATTLLYLEKKLVDLHTFVAKLPVLDQSEAWHFDDASNSWISEPAQTIRTKKVLQNHVKSPATDKFPAQVETFTEDVPVGTWTTIKQSGALPASRAAQLLNRVEKLQRAVKHAREQANMVEATPVEIGASILGYLFAR